MKAGVRDQSLLGRIFCLRLELVWSMKKVQVTWAVRCLMDQCGLDNGDEGC